MLRALLLAVLAACSRPEGEVYWACVDYYASAQECGREQGGYTPEEECDQYDLRYCDDGDDAYDEETCAAVEAELLRLDSGMAAQGRDVLDAFPTIECHDA